MLGQVLTALVGLGCLAEAVPTASKFRLGQSNETDLVSGGSVFAGLGQLAQLAQLQQLAEADLVSQVQSQLLLSTGLQSIKDNIRINSLRARYPQVNTVLVTVTNVVDARNPASINNRYLLNQLLVDNGFPDQQQVVMVTESQTYTITGTASAAAETATTETATAETATAETATPALDLSSILASVASAATATATPGLTLPLVTGAGLDLSSALGLGLGVGQGATAQIIQQTVTTFNPLAGIPLSFLNNPQALLLPYDTAAPSSALVLQDPANILYAGASGFLVQSLATLQVDCAAFAAGGNAFLGAAGLGSGAVFTSVQQAVSFQLTSIQVGGAAQVVPPSILLANPGLASALGLLNVTATTTASASAESTATAASSAATAASSVAANDPSRG